MANYHSKLYHSLDRAFADVRLMMDGKKKKKTAQEFLEELRTLLKSSPCDSSDSHRLIFNNRDRNQ